MSGPIVAIIVVALVALVVLVVAVRSRNDDLARIVAPDETAHVQQLAPHPALTVVPDGFTCLSCFENPALPERVWCTVCTPIVDQYPAEPIERGGLR